MYNPNMEAKVHELMELKRMKEALEAEIAAAYTTTTTSRRFSIN
jgi:hypothetical protein